MSTSSTLSGPTCTIRRKPPPNGLELPSQPDRALLVMSLRSTISPPAPATKSVTTTAWFPGLADTCSRLMVSWPVPRVIVRSSLEIWTFTVSSSAPASTVATPKDPIEIVSMPAPPSAVILAPGEERFRKSRMSLSWPPSKVSATVGAPVIMKTSCTVRVSSPSPPVTLRV